MPRNDYGWNHRRLRAKLKPFVESGEAICARCGFPIAWDEEFNLDHADDGSGEYLGVSHPKCNARAGGRRGGRVIARKRRLERAWSREWLSD